MRFSLDIDRTKLPLRYRRRTAFRNSKIRFEVSGYANYERWWLFGFDVALQWGTLDKEKPDWSYRNGVKTVKT